MFNKRKSVSTAPLEDAMKNSTGDKISIGDIMVAMNTGGFGLVIMFFSLPILIPLPPPLPSLIAIPLAVFSLQMIAGLKAPNLPKIISNRSIERRIIALIIEKSSVYFRRVEKLLKPRLVFLSVGIFERIIGFFIFIFSVSIFIPLPLTNFLPGIGILITSFGLIGKDGIVIILGIATGIFGITTTIVAIILGVEFISIAKEAIFNLF